MEREKNQNTKIRERFSGAGAGLQGGGGGSEGILGVWAQLCCRVMAAIRVLARDGRLVSGGG